MPKTVAISRKHILVVDDEPFVCDAVKMMLDFDGHSVETAHSAKEALGMFEEGKFDLVITDLRMPTFSGRGVLALASALPKLPVIIITAFGGPLVEAQALQLGAFAFLEKPVAAAELVDVVKRAIEASPIREV